MGSSFLFKSQGLEVVFFILSIIFEKCMLKIKAPTSIFSFDCEHMSVALRLTSGCGRDYVLYAGNYFELSGLKFSFLLKINSPKHKSV